MERLRPQHPGQPLKPRGAGGGGVTGVGAGFLPTARLASVSLAEQFGKIGSPPVPAPRGPCLFRTVGGARCPVLYRCPQPALGRLTLPELRASDQSYALQVSAAHLWLLD